MADQEAVLDLVAVQEKEEAAETSEIQVINSVVVTQVIDQLMVEEEKILKDHHSVLNKLVL